MLTCKEMAKSTDDYIEGRLSFGRKAGFVIHFAICKNCRNYVHQIRHIINLTQEASKTQQSCVSEPLKQDLMAAFKATHKNPKPLSSKSCS